MWHVRLEHVWGNKIIVGATTCDVSAEGLLDPQPSKEDAETYCQALPAVFRFEAPEQQDGPEPEQAEQIVPAKGPKKAKP